MVGRASGVVLALTVATFADVVTYEGEVFPENAAAPWERLGTFDADRWIENGWFHQYCDLGVWPGPRFGEDDWYRRSLADFAGEQAFFIEWVVETDAPSIILDFFGTPTVLSAFSNGAYYHFTFTDERVLVMRGTALPLVYANIEPGVPHTYYLELRGLRQYAWYIDGELIDAGVPRGPYPTSDSGVIWGARHDTYENHARWDYVRYGRIPEPGSGDYDSDGDVDLEDFYFFQECVSNSGPDVDAGPGCRFADFDADSDVDLADVAALQGVFTEST